MNPLYMLSLPQNAASPYSGYLPSCLHDSLVVKKLSEDSLAVLRKIFRNIFMLPHCLRSTTDPAHIGWPWEEIQLEIKYLMGLKVEQMGRGASLINGIDLSGSH